MCAEFDVKMTRKMLFRFLMYHAYHGFAGWFGTAAGLILIGLYVWSAGTGGQGNVLSLVFGILFLVYQPLNLYSRAATLVKLSPAYRHPMHYTVTGDGIEVSQTSLSGGGDAQTGADDGPDVPEPTKAVWSSVTRVREDKKCLFVYTGKRNACIWPKDQLGAQEEKVREILKKCVPATR